MKLSRMLTVLVGMALLFGAVSVSNAELLKVIPPVSGNTPITYLGSLANGSTTAGTSATANIGSPGLWDYWSFFAVAGDVPLIDVHRTTSAMDPAFTVFFGTTTDSAGLSSGASTQAGMTFIAFRDDNNGIPHGVGGLFSDPRLSGLALPSSGQYTLAVYDFIGAGGGPATYEIHISGITPEPSSLLMFGMGALGLAVCHWRRKRSRSA